MWNDTVARTDEATADVCAVSVPQWEDDINWGSSDSDSEHDTALHNRPKPPHGAGGGPGGMHEVADVDADVDASSSDTSALSPAPVHPTRRRVRKCVRKVPSKSHRSETVTEIRRNLSKNYFQHAAADEMSWEPPHHVAQLRNPAAGGVATRAPQQQQQPVGGFGWDNDAQREGGYQGHVVRVSQQVAKGASLAEQQPAQEPADANAVTGDHAMHGALLSAARWYAAGIKALL